MFIKPKRSASRGLFVFSVTLVFLFFQNCSGSFKSVTQETVSNSNGQSSENQTGAGGLIPTLPGLPSTPTNPTNPIYDFGNYKAVSGFNNLVNLNSRICSIDSLGSVSCVGLIEMPNTEDANGIPKSFYTDKLTDLNFNLSVKKLLENCILTTNEKVYCYRYNSAGELGRPVGDPSYASKPLEINLGEPVKSLAQAAGSICASLASGQVKCWGRRLDLPMVNSQLQVIPTPGPIAGLSNVKEVFANLFPAQMCALLTTNDVYCWGQNIDAKTAENWTYEPTKVFSAAGIKSVITGTGEKFCILFESGQVSCFSGRDGVTGLITVAPKINQVVEITTNEGTRCVRTSLGDVYCWGRNMFGRLGFIRNHREDVVAPTLIPEWKNAVSISASMYNTCALMADSTVKCLGLSNGSFRDWTRIETSLSQLGVSEMVSTVVPMPYGGACYRTISGSVQCLGSIDTASDFSVSSSIFQQTSDEILSKPVVLPNGTLNSIAFSRGINHLTKGQMGSGCFIDSAQNVKCFGANENGQVGNGTTTPSVSPVTVAGISNAVKVEDYGGYIRCAMTAQNRLFCWGANMSGVFDNIADSKITSPIEITKVGAIKDFFIDYVSLTVIQMDGSVKSYGGFRNLNFSGFKSYDYYSLCAHMNDNSVSCFNYTDSVYKKIENINSSSVQFFGSCLINDAKNVQCWGENNYGQLGQGDSVAYDPQTAMTVRGVSNASLVFKDQNGLTCAYVDENLGSQSKILCWGVNWESWNLSLSVFEKTELRGYKPIVNSKSHKATYFINSSGALKIFDIVRIPSVPALLLQRK